MRRFTLAIVLAFAIAGWLTTAPAGALVPAPVLELSPIPPEIPSVPIEIPVNDVETFYAHVSWDGAEGMILHIEDISWHVTVVPEQGAAWSVQEWYVQPSMDIVVSQWFPWNKVAVEGIPSTLLQFQADITVRDPSGAVWGPIWSNTVTKHITPEPSSLLAISVGGAGLGGILWRRSRG